MAADSALRTPAQVQRYLTAMPYNWELAGGTLDRFREVLKTQASPLPGSSGGRGRHSGAAWISAAVVDWNHRICGSCDLCFSAEGPLGLDSPFARYRAAWTQARVSNLRQLVWSYFDPYVDMTGRIKGYGLTSLYALGNYDWRFSTKTCTRSKIICARFRTACFARQIVDTSPGTSATRNTRSVIPTGRRHTMETGSSGCGNSSVIYRKDSSPVVAAATRCSGAFLGHPKSPT